MAAFRFHPRLVAPLAGRVHFRPSAYALLLREERLLVCRSSMTGRLVLPGGGVEPGEPLADAVAREVREEAGIEATVGGLVHVAEWPFVPPWASDELWHVLGFFFFATPRAPLRPPRPADHDIVETLWLPPAEAAERLEVPAAQAAVQALIGQVGG